MASKPVKDSWKRYDTKESPFLELKNPCTSLELVKLVLMFPLIVIRALLMILALLVLAIMSFIAGLGWPLEEPMPAWRRRIVTVSANCAGFVMLMLGFRMRVRGLENHKKAKELGAIGVFNHTAWVDAVALMYLFAPSGVSKESNAHLPLVGTCIRSFQNIYVSRASIENAKQQNGGPSVSEKIAERAKDRRFPMLVMAPEGTCGDGRCILRFRTGAFVPGVPVLPICFRYNKRRINPAWTIINEAWHFLRMMSQISNAMEITVLSPYVPSEEERASPALYAKNVQEFFCRTLGIPAVDQSQEEFTALVKLGVGVSWNGRRVTAPPGVLDENGFVDLTAAIKKRE